MYIFLGEDFSILMKILFSGNFVHLWPKTKEEEKLRGYNNIPAIRWRRCVQTEIHWTNYLQILYHFFARSLLVQFLLETILSTDEKKFLSLAEALCICSQIKRRTFLLEGYNIRAIHWPRFVQTQIHWTLSAKFCITSPRVPFCTNSLQILHRFFARLHRLIAFLVSPSSFRLS